MHFIRSSFSRRGSKRVDRHSETNGDNLKDDGHKPVSSHTAGPSHATASPSSTTSTISFPLVSPSPHFPTLHVCTRQPPDDSIILRLHSRARAANEIPTFHAGDIIHGDVILKFSEKDVQYVTSVDIQLQGEAFAGGYTKPNRFFSRKVNVWPSSGSHGPRPSPSLPHLRGSRLLSDSHTSGSDVGREADTGSISATSSSPPSSFSALRAASTLGRSMSSASSFLGSLRRSPSISLRNSSEAAVYTKTFSRQTRARHQIQASRAYVWPFELAFPQRISSRHSNSEIDVSSVPQTSPMTSAPSSPVAETIQSEELLKTPEEQGGVRAERYGVGWKDVPFVEYLGNTPFFRETLQSVDEGSKKSDAARNAPENLHLEKPLTKDTRASGLVAEPPVDERRTFQLPPTFSENGNPAQLNYRLLVIVKMRGAFRDNAEFVQPIVVQMRSLSDPVPRPHIQSTDGFPFVGPEQYPEGWKLMPEVVMQTQSKGYRLGKSKTPGDKNMDVSLKLAIARPLSFACGTNIPFRIDVSIPRSSSTPKRSKRDRSHPTPSPSFSGSIAIIASPPVAPDTPLASKTPPSTNSLQRNLEPSSRPQTPNVTATIQWPSVPSAATVASSLKLVRAVYVGENATDDGPRASRAIFLKVVSTAKITDDGADVNSSVSRTKIAGAGDEPLPEGWTSEPGRLVRTFSGVIPLNEDLKASFSSPKFVLRYAVVLSPFEGPNFTPLSTEPLWSETVAITTDPAKKHPGSESVSSVASVWSPVLSQGGDHRSHDASVVGPANEMKQQGDWQDANGPLSTSHVVAVDIAPG